MSNIYRKSVLEKLSSPEQLDRMIVITSPSFWLAMTGAGTIILVALFWSVFGRLPVTVKGNGIYISDAGVHTVYSDGIGVISSVEVLPGEQVEVGQTIAILTNSDAQVQVELLNRRITDLNSITLDSLNDKVTPDTKDLVQIKDTIRNVDSGLNQTVTGKTIWETEYRFEKQKLNEIMVELENAKSVYFRAIDNTGTGSIDQLELQNAETALAQAQIKWDEARIAVESMKPQYDSYIIQLDVLEKDVTAKGKKVEKNQISVRQAEEELKNAQDMMPDKDLSVSGGDDNESNALIENALVKLEQAKASLVVSQKELDLAKDMRDRWIEENKGHVVKWESSNKEMTQAKSAYDAAKGERDGKRKKYEVFIKGSDAERADLSKKQAEFSDLSTQYAQQQSIVRSIEQNLINMDAQVAEQELNVNQQTDSYVRQFNATKSALIQALKLELEQMEQTMSHTLIKSQQSGIVVELPVSVGSIVGQGSEIARLSSGMNSQEDNVVICYVPLNDGKKLRVDMPVMIYPTTVNKQEYGHMEARVLEIDEYVTSSAQMKNQLGDDLLVQSFTQEGPVIAVKCQMEKDAQSDSGFQWSSRKGRSVVLAEGTLVAADIVTERKAPIQMVIPLLKDFFSMKERGR